MVRRIGLIVLAGLAGVTAGQAAGLSSASNGLGAASATVPRCTTAALGVLNNLSGSNVASVTVSGIPSGCGGATLQLAVNNGSASGSGSTTIPVSGGSVTVSISPAVAASANQQTEVLITGP
jgi:hypothetical protein